MRLLGCLGRVGALLLVLGVLGIAWVWSPGLRGRAPPGGALVSAAEGAPELAAAAVERFESAVRERSARVSVSELELASLFDEVLSPYSPRGTAPRGVALVDGEIRVGAALDPRERLRGTRLDPLLDRMPPLPTLEVRLAPVSIGDREGVFVVRGVRVGGFPVPGFVARWILERAGPGANSGLPPEAIRLPLPPGVRSIQVREGSLDIELDS